MTPPTDDQIDDLVQRLFASAVEQRPEMPNGEIPLQAFLIRGATDDGRMDVVVFPVWASGIPKEAIPTAIRLACDEVRPVVFVLMFEAYATRVGPSPTEQAAYAAARACGVTIEEMDGRIEIASVCVEVKDRCWSYEALIENGVVGELVRREDAPATGAFVGLSGLYTPDPALIARSRMPSRPRSVDV